MCVCVRACVCVCVCVCWSATCCDKYKDMMCVQVYLWVVYVMNNACLYMYALCAVCDMYEQCDVCVICDSNVVCMCMCMCVCLLVAG